MVKLVHVSKVYSRGDAQVRALHDINLDVGRGEFGALVGPSGCGKSTLLNLVGGLDRPTTGDVVLNGRSTLQFTSGEWTRARRELIGIVFQAFHLVPGLTAAENVALPLLLKGEQGKQVHTRVAEVLDAVEMRVREQHRPSEMSGGEQQRVAIARAIVHKPTIILADEPTGNLDSKHGADVISLLRALPTRVGCTLLLATHSKTAAQQAHFVWSMQDGQLCDRHDDLNSKD
ncbi:MAG: ABC transporter ATP-binding protein [Nitrospiraceae bacterium]